jgi:hypothetical protein
MGDTKQHKVPGVETASSGETSPRLSHEGPPADAPAEPSNLTLFRRGEQIDDATASRTVDGFDAARMRDRSLLTAEEEKALMRRVDWRIMTICSLLFLMKNLDADNISNARIMNRGTDSNIMTQLKMSSDQYNLLNVLYYVSRQGKTLWNSSIDL